MISLIKVKVVGGRKMQTFANTGIKTEVIDEIISFAKNMIYIV